MTLPTTSAQGLLFYPSTKKLSNVSIAVREMRNSVTAVVGVLLVLVYH